ncbi:MAG: class I SAM-dependent methyltransferase [Bacteroidia bacterium]
MDKNYYVEYFTLERSNWWFKARLAILKNQLEKIAKGKNNLKILNIGAATGATSEMLEAFGTVKSIEYDKECFEFVKEKLNIDIEQGSILDLNFEENTFDIVCAFDVIEHVHDDEKAAYEMRRVCKKNGYIFVTVPAFMSLWGPHDVVNHHYRRYKIKRLKHIFSLNSRLEFVSYFNTLLFIPIFMVRFLSNLTPWLLKREGSGSDFGMFKSAWLNVLFYTIFILEKPILSKRIRLPFGVSAMIISRKIRNA